MTIKSTANGVNDSYRAAANARIEQNVDERVKAQQQDTSVPVDVERLVAAETGMVKAAFGYVLAQAEREIDKHFETADRLGMPPYNMRRNTGYGSRTPGYDFAFISVEIPGEHRSALKPHDVAQRFLQKLVEHAEANGFRCAAELSWRDNAVHIELSDPAYERINEWQEENARFDARG